MAHTPYDPSRDYIRYPTFAPLPDSRAQCKECGGSVFEFLLPQWKPVCLQCGTELPLPGIPQQPVQSEQPESEFHDIDFRTAFEQAWAEFDLAFTPNTPDQQNVQKKPDIQFCDGFCHTAFLRPDGTVRAVGANFDGVCDVEDWSGIQAIATGQFHTVGLCADGTVKAVGRNDSGQCNVQDWTGIRAIAAGHYCTVGLCMDGTVKAAGSRSDQCCQVQDWSNVIRIWAGTNYTAALTADGTYLCTNPGILRLLRKGPLKPTENLICCGFVHDAVLLSDGTVQTYGSNFDGQCDVQDWSGIQAIAAGKFHTVGLCADGTVKAVGENASGQCNVQDWTGIRAIAAGDYCTVGLCMDGTVKAAGSGSHQCCQVQNWSNVTRIWAGKDYAAALTADGTVLCTDLSIERKFR